MAATIESERAHASSETAVADARAQEPATVETATPDPRAVQLAGIGAGAASPPPWLGSDRGTVATVLGTIQRTAGNRAAVELLERHGATAGPVAQRSAEGSVADDGGRSPVLDVIGRGGGSTLDDATRTAMETRFGGADFRDVRLHTGAAASRSAESVGANAYTVGNEIVVRDGQLSEHTLAHELTHVQQQRSGPVDGTDTGDGVRVSTPSDRFEQAAEQTAQRLTASPSSIAPDAAAAPSAVSETADALAAAPPVQRAAAGADGVPDPVVDPVASFIGRWTPAPHAGQATVQRAVAAPPEAPAPAGGGTSREDDGAPDVAGRSPRANPRVADLIRRWHATAAEAPPQTAVAPASDTAQGPAPSAPPGSPAIRGSDGVERDGKAPTAAPAPGAAAGGESAAAAGPPAAGAGVAGVNPNPSGLGGTDPVAPSGPAGGSDAPGSAPASGSVWDAANASGPARGPAPRTTTSVDAASGEAANAARATAADAAGEPAPGGGEEPAATTGPATASALAATAIGGLVGGAAAALGAATAVAAAATAATAPGSGPEPASAPATTAGAEPGPRTASRPAASPRANALRASGDGAGPLAGGPLAGGPATGPAPGPVAAEPGPVAEPAVGTTPGPGAGTAAERATGSAAGHGTRPDRDVPSAPPTAQAPGPLVTGAPDPVATPGAVAAPTAGSTRTAPQVVIRGDRPWRGAAPAGGVHVLPPPGAQRPGPSDGAATVSAPPGPGGSEPAGVGTPGAGAAPSETPATPPVVASPQGSATPSGAGSRGPASTARASESTATDQAHAGTHTSPAPGADAPAMPRGFPERKTPRPPARPKPKSGARPGTPPRRRPAGPPPPPALHDPTLEKWRAAAGTAINATKPGDLGDAKDGPDQIDAKARDINSTRTAAKRDPRADAASHQPAIPAESKKDAYLDAGPADAAVDAVAKAGDRKLTTQSFRAIDTSDLPAADFLKPGDYVPKTLSDEITDLETKLKATDLKPADRAQMTKDLDARKKRVEAIEAQAVSAPGQEPPTIQDKGPAKLTPPDPAQGDVLGDAVARMMAGVDPATTEIIQGVMTSMRGDKVPRLRTELEKTEQPKLRADLEQELRGIATAAGVTTEQLNKKIEEQKTAAKTEADELAKKLAARGVVATTQVQDRGKTESTEIAGAAKGQQQAIEQKQAALSGPPDTSQIEKKRDEYLGRAEQAAAQALAGLRASITTRDQELDAAAGKQKGTIRQTADGRVAAIRRHFNGVAEPNDGTLPALKTQDWSRSHSALVDTEVRDLKAAAHAESDRFSEGVTNKAKEAKDSIRDWAAHQQGRERSWWDRLLDMIHDWGRQATANNEAWERQRNAETRDAIAADLTAVTQLREAQVTHNSEALNGEFARLSGDQRKLAQQFLSGDISGINFVAQSTMHRIRDRRVTELSKAAEERAIQSWDWEQLGQLARGSNPKFNPAELAAKVRGGVAGWGTDEDKVYAGLGGARTAVERAALAKCYEAKYHVSMEADVADDMGGHEMQRAKALMEGKSAEADAATIKEAVAGLGTDEAAIKTALRGKSKDEIEQIKAEYRRMYHTELDVDLADDMSGAELDNALALSRGDTTEADAADLQDAMAGPGTDEDKIKKVYEQIREEEEARARREGLTPAELNARIKDRNASVKVAYSRMYGGGDKDALDRNLKDELTDWDWKASYGLKRGDQFLNPVDDGDLKVVEALQSGDTARIDAAKAYQEHQGVYTSDDEIENIVRNQHKKADLEVNLDIGAQKARLQAQLNSGDIDPKAFNEQLAKIEEREKGKDVEINAMAQKNMGSLRDEYSKASGGTQTFDQLVLNETQGYSQLEIQDLVAAGGKLSDEQELYYATAGVGTDEDKIKEVLKGKTPAEIQKIREAYARKHPGHTLDDDILSDLSGREDLDVGHTLKYGDPETFGKQLQDEKDPQKRKELLAGMKKMLADRKAFEETGTIGQIFAAGADPMNSAAQLQDAVDRAEAYDKALADFQKTHPNMDPKDIAADPDLYAARANFEMNYGGALEAQEQVRQQIDAYADVAAQVGAAIAGIAVTVATLGTAGPVVAAIYGAVAAAATTMTLKANLRGAAYSWEEAGVDLAVGTVDAAVAGLTAGLSKGLTAALERAVAEQVAKEVAKEGVEKAGESVVKAWVKEAMREAVENALQGIPSAFVGAVLDDNTWKSGDPWGHILSATGQGAAQGAAMAVGMKGVKDVGGAAFKGIKGALKGEPRVEAGGPHAGAVAGPEPTGGAGERPVEAHASPGEARPGMPEPNAALPETKPVELPPEAKPAAAAEKAKAGELPPEAHGKDPTRGGQLPESAGPEPHAGKPESRTHAPEDGRSSPAERRGGEPTPRERTAGEAVGHDPNVISELPEGSVGMLDDALTRDAAANHEAFEQWHESDPTREVALLRNETTGEYILVQGGRGGVELGFENPNWAHDLLPAEQRAKGNWVFEAHSHPVAEPGGVTALSERWPSGGNEGGDFAGVAARAERTGQPVTESLRYIGDGGTPETLKYGYDPTQEKPYFVERPGPDGKPVRQEWTTIDDYHREFAEKFGREPGGPVHDDFKGVRDPDLQERPTFRPGELPNEGMGRGSTIADPDAAGTKLADMPPERSKPGGPAAEDVGKPLTREDLANRYGMPAENVTKIQAVCAEQGIIVDIRPTTPYAEPMLREGTALPKPEKVKAKTINETDVQIGLAKREDLGKVGFFDPANVEPRRPADFESLPEAQKKAIDDRIKQRQEEFADYRKDMQKLQDAGLIRVDPDGTVINTGLVEGGELPFTGDHDIFDIRAADGTKLSPEGYQRAKAALLAADAGIMHGGVTGWAVDAPDTFNTPAGQKSFGKMVDAHSPGGKEPLVRLGAGEPKAVWYEPASPPVAAGPSAAADVTAVPAAGAGSDGTAGPRESGTPRESEPGRSPQDEAELARLIAEQQADRARGDVGEIDAHADATTRDLDAPASAESHAGPGPAPALDAAAATPPAAPGPALREQVGGQRPDVGAAFAGADERFAASGREGRAPSERFDDGVRRLEAAGMRDAGRAEIEGLLRPGEGQQGLSQSRARAAADVVDHLAQVVEARPDLVRPDGQAHYANELEALHEKVRAAYEAGVTVEGRPIANPASPELADAMARMDAAVAGRVATPDDPVKGLVDLLRMRDEIARAAEILRSYDPTFRASQETFGMDPSRRFPGAHEQSLRVEAQGRVSEPLARDLPGMGLERYALTPADLGGLKTNPPELAGRMAAMLDGYHRSHLIGPGFGGELFEGMMLAPRSVNLELQNEGVEAFIRKAADRGNHVELKATAVGDRIVVPLADGGSESIDILGRVRYEITVNGLQYEVVIAIDPPPAGTARVIRNTIPAGAPGSEALTAGSR